MKVAQLFELNRAAVSIIENKIGHQLQSAARHYKNWKMSKIQMLWKGLMCCTLVGYSSLTYFDPVVAAREQGCSPDTASLGCQMQGVSPIMAGSYPG